MKSLEDFGEYDAVKVALADTFESINLVKYDMEETLQ